MGGYDYQVWQSIEAWLTIHDGEVLFLEGAEDIDRTSAAGTTTIQVKRTQEPVSLNSIRAREAIRNFWATAERSPERQVKFVYLSTSGISLERDARFSGVPGVKAWASAAHDVELAEAIREQLLKCLESDQPIRKFLETATTSEMQERLLKRFTWLMEQPNVELVEEIVLDRIAAELQSLGQPKSAARSVKSALFEYCWKQVLKEGPAERKLDYCALRQQIEAAITVTLELPLSAVAGLVTATAQLGSIQSVANNLVLLQDQPPAPPRSLLRRLKLVDDVSRFVQQRRAVLLSGSVFMGKTTIAQVVAQDVGLRASWTELSQREPAAIADIFKLLALTLDREDGPSLLIFDDLDTSPRARRTYELSLRKLVHRAEVAGKSLLFTAQGHTQALEREVANSWGLEIVQVPKMSQEEVAIQCADFGCTPAAHADTWSRVIVLQSDGHPALVHVRLLELRAEGWPAVSLQTFTAPSQATRDAKELARDLLASSATAAETLFALEAGEFSMPPSRAMLLNLAGLPPQLPGAAAVLANLTGRWIEDLGSDRFRVTQILRGETGVTWTPEQHRAIHAKLHDAIRASSPLDPVDAGSLIFHAFIAMDPLRFKLSVISVVTAEAEIRKHILKHCTWVLPVGTEDSPALSELRGEMPSLRHLQFLVADLEEPSRLESIAVAWRSAIGPARDDQHWKASRVVYDLTMLTSPANLTISVLLDAILSVLNAEEPFRSVVLEGVTNFKESMLHESFAFPDNATSFQILFSLKAGRVKSLEDFRYLIEWLGTPENRVLAREFDQMLDWSSVIELGAFIHAAWVAEADMDSPKWEPWIDCFDGALKVCSTMCLNRYGVQIARAKSIVLSEYLGDVRGAYVVLDEAVSAFGPSAVLIDQRVNLLGRSGDHPLALDAWDSLIECFGHSAVTDPFAYRRAAISAGKLEQFKRASELFEAGAELRDHGMYQTSVGLLVDASYCALRGGNKRQSSALLAKAVLLLPSEAREDGDRRWEAIVHAANAVAHMPSDPEELSSDGSPYEIAIGRASDPSLAVVESTSDQASRVGFLQTQVACLEAVWPDACGAVFEVALAQLDAEQLALRFNACKAFILRDATQGTSSAYLSYALKLARTASELNELRPAGEAIGAPLAIEGMLSGLLPIGILLARSRPQEMLESWVSQAQSLGDVSLLQALKRLQKGILLTTDAAIRESATFSSRDTLFNFGAALRVCHSDEVRARDVVMASLRIAGALDLGLASFFKASLHHPVARLFASRLSLQLQKPDQFAMPAVVVPALAHTVQQVIVGEMGIRGLLTLSCHVTGVEAEETLRKM